MTHEEFTHEIERLIPESSAELTSVWIGLAKDITNRAKAWLADSAEEIARGEQQRLADWYRPRAVTGNNLQEIHASLYNIQQRYGAGICRQIYELAKIPFCSYPLEAPLIAECLSKGGDSVEIERRYEAGEFEWDIPDDPALLTPTDQPLGQIEQQSEGLSVSRKAEMFDNLVDSVHGLMSDGSWYEIFREIGMDDDEMRSYGLDLSGLKLTESAISEMVDHIIEEIKAAETESHPLRIEFSVDDLAERFDIDLDSCQLAESLAFAELYSRKEIDSADLTDGKLFVTPKIVPMERQLEPEPPELTML